MDLKRTQRFFNRILTVFGGYCKHSTSDGFCLPAQFRSTFVGGNSQFDKMLALNGSRGSQRLRKVRVP